MHHLFGFPIRQFSKFAVVGVINTLINLAVLFALTDFFQVYYMFSAVIAFLVAVTNSFVMNKTWTFNEKLRHRAKSKYAKFITVSVIALISNLFFLYIFVEIFMLWYMSAQVLAIALTFMINFLGNKMWTFGSK
jgi:putative flippase GtrA